MVDTAQLEPETMAALAGVDISTARRWRRGAAIPEPARRLLALLTERDLGPLSRAWRGWRITREGLLVSDEQWTFTPGEVRALPLIRARLEELRNRYESPRIDPSTIPGAQCDWISGRWRVPE